MRYQPHEYVCIAAWGRRMGSFSYYITEQQKLAAAEHAPITAIYRQPDTIWAVAEDIKDPAHRRNILGSMYIEDEHGQYGTEYDVVSDRWDRLPRVCAAHEFTRGQNILITRGEAGYTTLSDDFDIDRFNSQRKISAEQIAAMLNGSMFGWEVPGADPQGCKDAPFLIGKEEASYD